MTGVDECAQFSRKGPFKVLVMQETIRYTSVYRTIDICNSCIQTLKQFGTAASRPLKSARI